MRISEKMSVFSKLVRTFLIASTVLSAIAISSISAQATRPKAPDTSTPSGNSTPGATRPEAACPNTPKPLTALLANQGKDFTIKEYPTFFFYIPYTPEQISSIEFLLLNQNQTKTIFRSGVQLTDKPGIIKIKIPSETVAPLEIDTTYHWRLNLDCHPDRTIAPDLVLNGWIRRVALSSEILLQLKTAKSEDYLVYQDRNIWYDAIANLGELYFTNSQNNTWNNEWSEMLSSLELDWVIAEPLVNSELEL